MEPINILENIVLSIIWGMNVALLFTRDFGFETAIVFGLVGGVFVAATLFLIVDQELDPEAAESVKAYFWGFGVGILAAMFCMVILQVMI